MVLFYQWNIFFKCLGKRAHNWQSKSDPYTCFFLWRFGIRFCLFNFPQGQISLRLAEVIIPTFILLPSQERSWVLAHFSCWINLNWDRINPRLPRESDIINSLKYLTYYPILFIINSLNTYSNPQSRCCYLKWSLNQERLNDLSKITQVGNHVKFGPVNARLFLCLHLGQPKQSLLLEKKAPLWSSQLSIL